MVALYYVHGHGAAKNKVDFNRDIRPIFNQICVSCHGGVRQKNGVSFIYREEALGKGKSGRPSIVPGHPESPDREPEKFSQAWHMLMKGSIVSAGEGNRDAARDAKCAARLVLEGWQRQNKSTLAS